MGISTAIDFGSLVGAQLTALIEAEAEAAEKSSEYIENVGFEKKADGTLKLRMVTFEMDRRDVDGEVRKHTIQIPVLTLVPIPLLTIEQVDMEFDLQIEEVRQTKAKTQPATRAVTRDNNLTLKDSIARKFDKSLVKAKPKLLTRFARRRDNNTKINADLNMKVRVAQSPFPIGIERLINTADLSVEDKTDE